MKGRGGERARAAKKTGTGHFFLLGMREHHLRHYALAGRGPGGGNEHDMHALKRKGRRRCASARPRGAR